MTSQSPKSRKIKKPVAVMITICLLLAVSFAAQSCQTETNAEPNATTSNPAQNSTQSSQPTEASTQSTTSVINQNAIMTGLSIGGFPVAGKTRAEALTVIKPLAEQLLSKYDFSIVVDGAQTRLTAKELGLTTNLEAVLDQALAYGKTGSADERKQAEDLAKNQGVDLKLHVIAQKDSLIAGLQVLKSKADKAPVDAVSVFMPNGFTADGKPFVVDPRKLADTQAVGKNISRPELVKVDAADTPNPLRYLYWQTDHYQKGYIPADASISRFLYTPEVAGRSLDLDATAQQILAQVESGSLTPVNAVFKTIEATVTLKDVKNETQLIASWTSSYRSHAGTARNWNVSRMASFINGNTIRPGEQWTINKTAGPRNDTTARTIGWKKAAGIENGGYTQQVGGGVCQLGSTTYNAAIRAGLTIVSSTHHTIPSDYIPLGLDATLSTPVPDLILKNDNTRPVYLVSYVNPIDKNVTVEVYGQPVIDPTHGPVILDFTSDNRGKRYGTPTMRTIYNATIAKDDTVLSAENPVYVYAKPRMGTEIQTYKHVYALDGTRLAGPTPFTNHKYPVINGTTYVFGPDPATVTPTPTPPPVTPTPTTPPPATPAA